MLKIGSLLLIAFLFFSIPNFTQASTGTIVGRIIDSETKEPLIGVTVLIENTTQGTATDINGDYVIINVTPGNYTLLVSYVGYGSQRIENVMVFQDRNTEIKIELRPLSIQAEELIVRAERPIVERDRTTTVSHITAQTLEELPVTDLRDVVKLQAGIVTGAGGALHFRGGRSREAAYLVDGVPVTNTFNQSGGSTAIIENSFINEVQVITGTFDAQYGSAQSGVISVVTKDPGRNFEGQVAIYAGDYISSLNNRYVGINQLNPATDRDVQFTLNGPLIRKNDLLGVFISGRYNASDGYLKGQQRFNTEDGWKIEAYQRWFREFNSLVDTRLIPIPETLATGDGSIVDMDKSQRFSGTVKFLLRPTSSSRLTYSLLFADGQNQSFSTNSRFSPDGRATNYNQNLHHILNVRQIITESMFLNVRGSLQSINSKSYAFASPTDAGYVPVSFNDTVTGFSVGGVVYGRNFRENRNFILNADYTWQINRFNEFKAGVEYRSFVFEGRNRGLITEENSRNFPDTRGQFIEFEDYLEEVRRLLPQLRQVDEGDSGFLNYSDKPIEFSAFVQDRVEFGNNLVVRLGLRYDWFNSRGKSLINERSIIDQIGSPDNQTNSETQQQLSPRIGISYPISDRGAFRVAYGHFFQMPSYSLMYQNPIDELTSVGRLEGATVGNTNLKPERTIKYEMGLQQQLGDSFGIDVSAYYSNIRNLLGLEILSTLDNITYRRYTNRDYGAVRGITVSFQKIQTRNDVFSGAIDYTFQHAKGSSSNPNDLQTVQLAERIGDGAVTFVERQILPLDWDQRHTLNVNATISWPSNWLFSVIGTYGSGLPYTPSSISQRDFPESEFKNSALKPIRYNVDLNVRRTLSIAGTRSMLYIRVFNLLDTQNENFVDSKTGRATQIGRTPFELNERINLLQTIDLFTLEEDNNRPSWFSAPRRVQLGLIVNF